MIEGFIPVEVVRTISVFLDFYCIVRMDSFMVKELNTLNDTLHQFQKYRTVFQKVGVCNNATTTFSLPCQHAMAHYWVHIKNFRAPSGLCTSMPESKHKSVIK